MWFYTVHNCLSFHQCDAPFLSLVVLVLMNSQELLCVCVWWGVSCVCVVMSYYDDPSVCVVKLSSYYGDIVQIFLPAVFTALNTCIPTLV